MYFQKMYLNLKLTFHIKHLKINSDIIRISNNLFNTKCKQLMT